MYFASLLAENFLLWKPVCYTNPSRNLKFLSAADYSRLSNADVGAADFQRSIGHAFFKNSVEIRAFNITFGSKNDGFYSASNFTVW